MIIYLHAAGLVDTGAVYGRHLSRDTHQIIVPENTLPSRIRDIVTQSFSGSEDDFANGTVELLLINSHGSPGRLHLGGITNSESDIDIHNVNELTGIFRPLLKPVSQGGEGVEIHGCGIAAASLMMCNGEPTDEIDDPEIGYRFVYALACGFNSRVRASASDQVPDYEGLFEDTLVQADADDDEDWHGHVFRPLNTGLLHEGGFMTQLRAMTNPPPISSDLRTARRVRSRERLSRHSMRY